jgi:hypothetical protein
VTGATGTQGPTRATGDQGPTSPQYQQLASGNKASTVTLRINGVNTAITCATAASSNSSCFDISHTATFVAGDRITVRTTAAASPVIWTAQVNP